MRQLAILTSAADSSKWEQTKELIAGMSEDQRACLVVEAFAIHATLDDNISKLGLPPMIGQPLNVKQQTIALANISTDKGVH